MINDEMYEKAREYGESVGKDALEEARRFSREELEREYANAVSHAAYYAKIESNYCFFEKVTKNFLYLLPKRRQRIFDLSISIELL